MTTPPPETQVQSETLDEIAGEIANAHIDSHMFPSGYAALRDAILSALRNEREACAKVADKEAAEWLTASKGYKQDDPFRKQAISRSAMAQEIAKAIRERTVTKMLSDAKKKCVRCGYTKAWHGRVDGAPDHEFEMPSDKDKQHSYKCADCRVTISADTRKKAWEHMRAHTLAAHGREPYVNLAGEYPDDETRRRAQYGAHPEIFLILAA